jgi:GNAT superfamily N-acetyltransferase
VVRKDDAPVFGPAELRDGTIVQIEPMHRTDGPRLDRFHHTLSAETTRLRFFHLHPELSERELHRFTHVDHLDREAMVAVHEDQIIAVARFDRLEEPTDAEAAFVVADEWQGRGLGSILLGRLAARAIEVGVHRLVADTLFRNRRMLAVFRHAGYPYRESLDGDVVGVVLDLAPAAAADDGSAHEPASPA